jgi:hypothetical protein
MAGGPLAGFLIPLIGPAQVLFIDAATFAISASLIWRLVPPPAQEKTTDAAGGYLGGLREGVRPVWNDRLIRAVPGI